MLPGYSQRPAIGRNGRAMYARRFVDLRIDYFEISETKNGPLEEEHQYALTLWNTDDVIRIDGTRKDLEAIAHRILHDVRNPEDS